MKNSQGGVAMSVSLKYQTLQLSFSQGVQLSANSENEFTDATKLNLLGLISWCLAKQHEVLGQFKDFLGLNANASSSGQNAVLLKDLRSEVKDNSSPIYPSHPLLPLASLFYSALRTAEV
jgi:hypothetical protein